MPPTSFLRVLARAPRSVPSTKRFASHGHGPQYNEPSGWLFSEKPPAAGQKRVKEEWETIWYVGMYGSIAVATVLLYYKPNDSLRHWAHDQAKARMEERGENTNYP